MSNIFENSSGFGNNGTPSWSKPVQSPPFSGGDSNSNSNGSGSGSGNASKPAISFPKQSMTTNFSPSVGNNNSNASGNSSGLSFGGGNSSTRSQNSTATGMSSFGQTSTPIGGSAQQLPSFGFNNSSSANTNMNTNAPSNLFGMNSTSAQSNPFGSTSFATPTTFQSPISSINANTAAAGGKSIFQPNSLLSRPSSSSSSPTTSFLNQNVGLRRRGGGGGGGGGGNTNASGNSNTNAVHNRPPLPSMTRLGVSMDATNDFKENINTSINKKNDDIIQRQTQPQKRPPQSSVSTANDHLFSAASTNYNGWVIIYGFTNSLEYNTILSNFEGYGMIVDKYPSTLSNLTNSSVDTAATTSSSLKGGRNRTNDNKTGSSNWVCVKYKSSLQADKALCQHGSLVHIIGGSSAGTSQTHSSNVGKDTIVIIGVMQMDENLAMKLGLKNYLEMGSTGFERMSTSNNTAVRSNLNDDLDDKSNKKNVRFTSSSIMNEDDILLLGDDLKRKRGSTSTSPGTNAQVLNGQLYNNPTSDGAIVGGGGVCEKVLAWFFGW